MSAMRGAGLYVKVIEIMSQIKAQLEDSELFCSTGNTVKDAFHKSNEPNV